MVRFTIGSTRVVTNASTDYRKGACHHLRAGVKVTVEGTIQADSSLRARRITFAKRQDDEDDDDDDDDD